MGLEDRLKSRFGWVLTAAIEPAELETRGAILMSKASQSEVELPSDVAFFIAQHIQSNIRELEGALRRVMASARFTGQVISLDLAKEALRDLLVLQDKLVKINPTDGSFITLLTDEDGLHNPASIVFGVGDGDQESIFFVNYAVLPPVPSASLGPAVLKLDVGVPGLQ